MRTPLYKNHNRFRNDKVYKDLRMLEKTLQKFLNHKFLKSLTDFFGFIPNSPSSHLKTYLPPQSMGFLPYPATATAKQTESVAVDIESSVEVKEQTVTVNDFLDLGEPVKRTTNLSSNIGEKIRSQVEPQDRSQEVQAGGGGRGVGQVGQAGGASSCEHTQS